MINKTIWLTLNTTSTKARFLQQHGRFTLISHSPFRLHYRVPNTYIEHYPPPPLQGVTERKDVYGVAVLTAKDPYSLGVQNTATHWGGVQLLESLHQWTPNLWHQNILGSADFQVFFSSVHQRAMMTYVTRRNLVVFRAGTAHEPLFTSSYIEDNSKEGRY